MCICCITGQTNSRKFSCDCYRQVARLDSDVGWARGLDGTEFMPGLVGLNNMKANDYANVIIQVPHSFSAHP